MKTDFAGSWRFSVSRNNNGMCTLWGNHEKAGNLIFTEKAVETIDTTIFSSLDVLGTIKR